MQRVRNAKLDHQLKVMWAVTLILWKDKSNFCKACRARKCKSLHLMPKRHMITKSREWQKLRGLLGDSPRNGRVPIHRKLSTQLLINSKQKERKLSLPVWIMNLQCSMILTLDLNKSFELWNLSFIEKRVKKKLMPWKWLCSVKVHRVSLYDTRVNQKEYRNSQIRQIHSRKRNSVSMPKVQTHYRQSKDILNNELEVFL